MSGKPEPSSPPLGAIQNHAPSVMIGLAPLLPLLDIARKAHDDMAVSEAHFKALSRVRKHRQVGTILDPNRPYELTYGDAVWDIMPGCSR